MTLLRHDVHREGPRVVLALSGELDISAADVLQAEVEALEGDPGVENLVLDLRELEFLDSTGLRLVVTADLRAKRDGRRFAVVRGGENVQRVFELTGLVDRLPFVDDPAEVA